MLRILCHVLRPTSGSATILGHDVSDRRFLATKVAVSFATPQFYEFLTGRQVLRTLVGAASAPPEIDAAFSAVGLTAAADARVRTYSTGMRQRLGIASVIMLQPDVWLLDEPFASLDPVTATEVSQIIRQVSLSGGCVLVATHALRDIEQLCTHVVLLHNGRLVATGALSQILGSRTFSFACSHPDAALTIIQRVGCDAKLSAKGRVLVDCHHERVPAIVRELVQASIDIRLIEEQRPSLEDWYTRQLQDEAHTDQRRRNAP